MSGFNSKRDAAADKLQEPAQEPVLWAAKESMFMWGDSDEHGHPYHVITKSKKVQSHQIPLYTTPPQREPLTDADYVNACISYRHDFGLMTQEQRDKLIFQAREWARAFGMNEAAHGIKE